MLYLQNRPDEPVGGKQKVLLTFTQNQLMFWPRVEWTSRLGFCCLLSSVAPLMQNRTRRQLMTNTPRVRLLPGFPPGQNQSSAAGSGFGSLLGCVYFLDYLETFSLLFYMWGPDQSTSCRIHVSITSLNL